MSAPKGHLWGAIALRLLCRPLRGVQRGVAPLQGVLHALHDPASEVLRVCNDQMGILLVTDPCRELLSIMSSGLQLHQHHPLS